MTATFRQRDGRTLHVRKATLAEPALREIYEQLWPFMPRQEG